MIRMNNEYHWERFQHSAAPVYCFAMFEGTLTLAVGLTKQEYKDMGSDPNELEGYV